MTMVVFCESVRVLKYMIRYDCMALSSVSKTFCVTSVC